MSRGPGSVYNYQTFSQSQKISIGIVVDSVAPRPTKETNSVAKVLTLDCNAAAKTVQFEKRASVLNGLQPTHSAQTGRNEALLEPGVCRKRDADSRPQNNSMMSGAHQGSEKENFSAACTHACVSNTKDVQEQTGRVEIESIETLRMNLRQLLGAGTNPFSCDKVDCAETREVGAHEIMQEQNAKGECRSKSRQNSDTIETDSENVSLSTKRPLTRARARKKASVRERTRNLKPKSLPCDRNTKLCNSTSSSAKKCIPSQSRGSLVTEHSDGAKKSYRIKPGDLLLPSTGLKNIQPKVTGGEKATSVKEPLLQSVMRPSSSLDCLNDGAKESYRIKPGDLLLPSTGLKNIQPKVTGGEKATSVKEPPLQSVMRPSSSHDCLNDGAKKSHMITTSDLLSSSTGLKNIQPKVTGGEKATSVKEPSLQSVMRPPSSHDCLNDGAKKSHVIKTSDLLFSSTGLKNIQPKVTGGEKATSAKEPSLQSVMRPPSSHDCLNDGAKKSDGIKPGDLLFSSIGLKNIQPKVTGGEKATSVKEPSLQSVMRPPSSHDCLNENIELQDSGNPVLQEKSVPYESFGFQTPAAQEDHDVSSGSPLFKMRKFVVSSSSPNGSSDSSQKAGPSIVQDKCSTMSSPATESNNNSGSSDGTATPDDRYSNANASSIQEKDADDGLFTPDNRESDSSKEVSSTKRAYMEDAQTSSENEHAEEPIFLRNKRRRSQDVDFDDFSPAFNPPKAAGPADDIFMDASEENADNELARVISLLGLALEKVKSKMALATNRRCLDILMSASEEIHSQLQDVESQILTDVRKLTCLKTFNKKHLETRLQEQQEHLKAIHEKFTKEIQTYLLDCRGAMEGLETQHIELKGAMETQKASHRKLVLQAEAAVDNHITDTHRKIVSVSKMRNKKMQQLRNAIGECLKDLISV